MCLKKVFIFPLTSTLVVVVSSSLQKRKSFLMSLEQMYLTNTSSWAHEITPVDSSTWNENIGDYFNFIYQLFFNNFRYVQNSPLESIIWKRNLFKLRCIASPRTNLAVFNKQSFTSVSPILCDFFCLAISSATTYDAFITDSLLWLKISVQSSLWCFKPASWRWKKATAFSACWSALFLSGALIGMVS